MKFNCMFLGALLTVLFFSCKEKTNEAIPDNYVPPPVALLELIPNTGNWDAKVQVYKDLQYNNFFTRYGNGWTGGDATYSTKLPDGRIMWTFGDTFFGTVNSDWSRPNSSFVRNSVMIQNGESFESFQTVGYGTLANPKPFIEHANKTDHWYWPLDATIHNGKIQFLLSHLQKTGNGAWDFEVVGTDLAIVSMTNLSTEQLISNKYTGEINYGATLLEDPDGFTYIYGISSHYLEKKVHVARVPNGDLTQAWQYWNGVQWVASLSTFSIFSSASDQFSMIKDGNKYYLISQEILFDPKIFIAESDKPTGPFTNKRILYSTPETNSSVFTYNAFVHPELSKEGELVISYNINSNDFSRVFSNADLYRPKFIRVKNWK